MKITFCYERNDAWNGYRIYVDGVKSSFELLNCYDKSYMLTYIGMCQKKFKRQPKLLVFWRTRRTVINLLEGRPWQ